LCGNPDSRRAGQDAPGRFGPVPDFWLVCHPSNRIGAHMNIWAIVEPYILIMSLFGFVALLVWWVGLMMTRNTGSRLRDRLKGNVEKKPEPMGKKKLNSIFQSMGEVAASPLMPKTREEQYEMKRRLAKAGIYAAGAIRIMQ